MPICSRFRTSTRRGHFERSRTRHGVIARYARIGDGIVIDPDAGDALLAPDGHGARWTGDDDHACRDIQRALTGRIRLDRAEKQNLRAGEVGADGDLVLAQISDELVRARRGRKRHAGKTTEVPRFCPGRS